MKVVIDVIKILVEVGKIPIDLTIDISLRIISAIKYVCITIVFVNIIKLFKNKTKNKENN